MKVEKTLYKGVFAIKCITDKYTAIFLPYEGGKIASFTENISGREYLVQNPSDKFLHLGLDGDFVSNECAGFDDMFPTIDPVSVEGILYPDHGEVCRLPFFYDIKKNKLKLYAKSESINYIFGKTVSEGKNGELIINYSIENLNSFPLSALWAGHLLLDTTPGGKVITPFKDNTLGDMVSDLTGKYRKDTERIKITPEMLEFKKDDLEESCYKIYYPEKTDDGYVGFEFLDGKTFLMRFSKEIPYLGVWFNNYIFKGMRCVGLEPCSLGYDTVLNAEKHGITTSIQKNEAFSFQIRLEVK